MKNLIAALLLALPCHAQGIFTTGPSTPALAIANLTDPVKLATLDKLKLRA